MDLHRKSMASVGHHADRQGEMNSVTATLLEGAPLTRVRPAPGPCLHQHPPITPGAFFREHRHLLLAIGAVFGFLAVAAAVADGWLLLRWDEPIQRFVE